MLFMKKSGFIGIAITFFLFLPFSAFARSIPAIVPVEWLEQNLVNPDLVVVDIRSSLLYKKNHIPGALNAPFASWLAKDSDLMLELPADQALLDLLGSLGISRESAVVVVNKTDSDWDRADATRVAWTCTVAGIENVSVLDGGYNYWLNLNKPVTADIVPPIRKTYIGDIRRATVTSKDSVMNNIGRSVLIDARLPEDYFGVTENKGHIQSALNLPAPWAYTSVGLFKDLNVLQAMASGIIGENAQKEIIVYCEVGGFASTWWFILSEVLGYQNVKIYDGSFQEWSKDPLAPVTVFSWK